MLKKFVKNIVLFLLPVVLVLSSAYPFYLMAASTGEFAPIMANIQRQRNDTRILLGLGYLEQTPYYKLVNANYFQPKLMALGTSRVMQFECEFFKDGVFYNCGGGVYGNYDEYLNFLRNLTFKPEIIVLGLDSWVFNDAWNKHCEEFAQFREIQESHGNFGFALFSIIKDWFSKKWAIAELNAYPKNIGFNGRVKDKGFRIDGSHYYGDVYRYPELQTDYKFVNTLYRISTGTTRFEYGSQIDTETLIMLEELLKYCKDNNISVIGFVPPFAPSIYKTMRDSGNYDYFNGIAPACEELFKKYNFEFFDYADGAVLNVSDDYFIDGFHGSEVVYGYITKDMTNKHSRLEKYVNKKRLELLLENAYNGLVFKNPDAR